MELERALDRISQIHAHLDRTEVYRGYRAWPVALTGVCAVAAAAFQARLGGSAFVRYWVAVGALCVVVSSWAPLLRCFGAAAAAHRRRTLRVFQQIAPGLAAGALLAVALADHPGLLPGLWALLFAQMLAATRPFLPRGVGWLSLYYLVAGAALLARPEPSPWGMGLVFGAGQLAAGLLLYREVERGV